MTNLFSFTVHQAAPERLDKLLAQFAALTPALMDFTRSQLKSWIEAGRVTVDGKMVSKAGTLIKPGSRIAAAVDAPGPPALSPYEFPLEIMYEDDLLLVVNKPAGLTMHPGAGNPSRTLVNALVSHFAAGVDPALLTQRLGLVHRLDKDTTGVVVIAKTLGALNALLAQFKERTIGRSYQALVLSTPRAARLVNQSESGTIETRIARHPSKRTLMAVVESGGRPAVTHWERVEELPYACLLRLRLETGRTHQIRVHLNHVGAPVIGDQSYGDFSALPKPLKVAAGRLGRQALHAEALSFVHPAHAQRLEFRREPPDDFKQLVEEFRNYGRR